MTLNKNVCVCVPSVIVSNSGFTTKIMEIASTLFKETDVVTVTTLVILSMTPQKLHQFKKNFHPPFH